MEILDWPKLLAIVLSAAIGIRSLVWVVSVVLGTDLLLVLPDLLHPTTITTLVLVDRVVVLVSTVNSVLLGKSLVRLTLLNGDLGLKHGVGGKGVARTTVTLVLDLTSGTLSEPVHVVASETKLSAMVLSTEVPSVVLIVVVGVILELSGLEVSKTENLCLILGTVVRELVVLESQGERIQGSISLGISLHDPLISLNPELLFRLELFGGLETFAMLGGPSNESISLMAGTTGTSWDVIAD